MTITVEVELSLVEPLDELLTADEVSVIKLALDAKWAMEPSADLQEPLGEDELGEWLFPTELRWTDLPVALGHKVERESRLRYLLTDCEHGPLYGRGGDVVVSGAEAGDRRGHVLDVRIVQRVGYDIDDLADEQQALVEGLLRNAPAPLALFELPEEVAEVLRVRIDALLETDVSFRAASHSEWVCAVVGDSPVAGVSLFLQT